MIATVFIRRLKEGATFEQFIAEWEADVGFGVPTRVVNAPSLTDPREILSIGFVAVSPAELAQWTAEPHESEQVRHDRIDSVIESTELKAMFNVRTEHDFTATPTAIDIDSAQSIFAPLLALISPERPDATT